MENQEKLLESSKSTLRRLQRSIAVIALIALLLDSLVIRSLIILAPFIRSKLGVDESQFGYFMSALMLGTLLTTLPIGSLLGRSSTRRAFGIIMTVTGVGLFVVAYQNTFYGLIFALFFVGILRAGIIPLTNRVIAECFASDQRGSITGLIFAAVPLGGFLGALVLPALGETFNWGVGYQLLGIVALIGGILAWILLPGEKNPHLVAQVYAATDFLKSKSFITLAIAYGLFALCTTTETFVTLYLVDTVKISALLAGTFFGMIQLTGIVGRLFWGMLADRYFSSNRWWLLTFTSGILMVSIALLGRLNSHSPQWLVAIVMIGFGLSAASSWGILCILVGDVVGLGAVASATAVVYFVTNIMDGGGPVLFGNVLKTTQSYRTTFDVYAVISAIAMIAFLWMALRNRLVKTSS